MSLGDFGTTCCRRLMSTLGASVSESVRMAVSQELSRDNRRISRRSEELHPSTSETADADSSATDRNTAESVRTRSIGMRTSAFDLSVFDVDDLPHDQHAGDLQQHRDPDHLKTQGIPEELHVVLRHDEHED